MVLGIPGLCAPMHGINFGQMAPKCASIPQLHSTNWFQVAGGLDQCGVTSLFPFILIWAIFDDDEQNEGTFLEHKKVVHADGGARDIQIMKRKKENKQLINCQLTSILRPNAWRRFLRDDRVMSVSYAFECVRLAPWCRPPAPTSCRKRTCGHPGIIFSI